MSAFAANLPDPGSPEFPAIVAVVGAFLGAAVVLRRSNGDWEQAEQAAFKWGFHGTASGLLIYLATLVADLY